MPKHFLVHWLLVHRYTCCLHVGISGCKQIERWRSCSKYMALGPKAGCLSTGLSVNWKEKFASYFCSSPRLRSRALSTAFTSKKYSTKNMGGKPNTDSSSSQQYTLLRSQHDKCYLFERERVYGMVPSAETDLISTGEKLITIRKNTFYWVLMVIIWKLPYYY